MTDKLNETKYVFSTKQVVIGLLTIFLITGCLPDHDDHSHCAPTEKMYTQWNWATIITPSGEYFDVPYGINGANKIAFGDIHLGGISDKGIIEMGRRWINGVIPYVIDPSLKHVERKIQKAMRNWEEKANKAVQFVVRTDQSNYLEIFSGSGCWSYVGMRGGKQQLSLGKGCTLKRTIMHELGHALGLWHEQSRSDRDEYVEVKWCNIKEQHKHNFFKRGLDSMDVGEYDYRSIMHYPAGAFSSNRKITLKSRTDRPVFNWGNFFISQGDRQVIMSAYSSKTAP